MHGFFTWHPLALLVFFGLFALFLMAFGALMLRKNARQLAGNVDLMPVPVLLSLLGTTWALAFGFTASDVWGLNNTAAQAASSERSSLSRMLGMVQVDALNQGQVYQDLLKYRTLVAQKEWGQDFNGQPHHDVEQSLQAIRMGLLVMAEAGNTPDTIMARMIDDFDELQDARNTRLAIGASDINVSKWCFLVVFALLVQLTIAIIHADRIQGGRKALLLNATMVALSLYVLALHANPYVGIAKITPQILFSMPF